MSDMIVAKYRLTGTAPMLMHNGRLSDPLAPIVRHMGTICKKGNKKTEEDHEILAKLEWYGSLYHDGEETLIPRDVRVDNGKLIVPSAMVEAMLVDAAKKTKDGKRVKAGLRVLDSPALKYDGPNDINKFYGPKSIFRASAKVGQSRVMRTRPIIRGWSFDVTVHIDPDVLDESDVWRFMETGGSIIGLGDWRPKYGRFEAERINGN